MIFSSIYDVNELMVFSSNKVLHQSQTITRPELKSSFQNISLREKEVPKTADFVHTSEIVGLYSENTVTAHTCPQKAKG